MATVKTKKKAKRKARKKKQEIPEDQQTDMEQRKYAITELEMKPDDQFYQDKDLNLDDAAKDAVVKALSTLISKAEGGAYNSRKQREFKRADWLWKAKINPRTFPYHGAASVGIPLIKTKGRKIERSLDGEVNRSRPVVPMVPTEVNDVDKTQKAEKYLDWKSRQMRADIPRGYSIRDSYKYGTGLMKTIHVVEKERVTETEIWDGRFENENREDEIFRFAEKYPEEIDYAVKLLKGEKLSLTVSYEKTLYRGPRLERVPRPNFIGPEGYTEIEKMPWYFEKLTFSWAELEDGVRENRFGAEILDRIKSNHAPKTKGGKGKTKSIKDRPNSEDDYLHKKYTVYEGMWKYAAGSKVRERCMFTILPEENIYLRGIKYPFNHSHPYITAFFLIRDPDNFDGECVAMDLEDIQILHNMIVNNALDSDMFNMPTFWQTRDSMGEEFDPAGWYPGRVWAVENKDDIGQMPGSASHANSIGLMQVVARFGDDVSGVSELMSGRETSLDPNAPGNKSEMLLGESKQDMGSYLRTWTKSYNEVWWQVCELLDQYGTDGEEFRVLNEGGEAVFESAPDSLGVRPDMEPRTAQPIFSADGKKMLTSDLMEKLQQDQILLPYIQQRPDLWMELWERYADSSGPGLTKIMYEIGEFIKKTTQTQEGMLQGATRQGMQAGERLGQRGAMTGFENAGMGIQEAMGGGLN